MGVVRSGNCKVVLMLRAVSRVFFYLCYANSTTLWKSNPKMLELPFSFLEKTFQRLQTTNPNPI